MPFRQTTIFLFKKQTVKFELLAIAALSQTRIFGAQNPPRDGGERKNLPKSFLNRFAKVYLNDYTPSDQVKICGHEYPSLEGRPELTSILTLINDLQSQVSVQRRWGHSGSPWTFNLRDALRWCQATVATSEQLGLDLSHRLASLLFVERFRTQSDSDFAELILRQRLCPEPNDLSSSPLSVKVSQDGGLCIGAAKISKSSRSLPTLDPSIVLAQGQMRSLESLVLCIQNRWVPILVGREGVGKTTMVRIAASLHEQV